MQRCRLSLQALDIFGIAISPGDDRVVYRAVIPPGSFALSGDQLLAALKLICCRRLGKS
jgi:hypothetical protein